jgi:hypothetical protein
LVGKGVLAPLTLAANPLGKNKSMIIGNFRIASRWSAPLSAHHNHNDMEHRSLSSHEGKIVQSDLSAYFLCFSFRR